MLLFAGCKTTKDEKFVQWNGRIANAQNDSVYLLLNNREKAFALDFDGNFQDTMQLVQEGYKTFSVEREEFTVYLIPGDSLILNLDLAEIENNFSFSGKGKNRNNYLIQKQFKTDRFLNDSDRIFHLAPEDFRKACANLHRDFMNDLKQRDIDPSFITIEEKNLQFDMVNLLYIYKDSYAYFNPDKPQLPVDFLKEVLDIDMDNEDHFSTFTSYRSIVLAALQEKLYQGFSADVLLQTIKSPSIKKAFLQTLVYELNPKDVNSEAIYQAILKHTQSPSLLKEAKKRKEGKWFGNSIWDQIRCEISDFR